MLSIVSILLCLADLHGQPQPIPGVVREHYDDPPGLVRSIRYSPPALRDTIARQVNVSAAGLNILGDAANETSIAIDPTAPNRIVIAWRQFDTIASNFRQAGYAYSLDGGRVWNARTLNPGVFRTDPVIRFDAEGVLYWDALFMNTNLYRCDFFKSFNAGRTWTSPVIAFGGDKAWFAIDRTTGPGRGNIYQAWNIVGSYPGTFNRSIDHALTWSAGQSPSSSLCWGQVAIGPEGEVYINGAPNSGGQTFFTRSLDARTGTPTPTFSPAAAVNMGGSFYSVGGSGYPNPAGLQGMVNLRVDTSNGPRRGWIYTLQTTNPAGVDPADVMLARSENGGLTWSAPVRVNTDPPHAAAWQWFATMSISPGGRLDVVWVDTRESLQPNLGRLYYRSSPDGGSTWSAETPLGPAWNSWIGWPNQNKIGDYYDMESDDLGAAVAFAATYNGEQDVYFLRIGPEDCNRNGVADSDDIAAAAEQDCNGNGIPDSCEYAAGTLVHADADGDLLITPADIAAFVQSWFVDIQSGTLVADADRDRADTPADVAFFVQAWLAAITGPCR